MNSRLAYMIVSLMLVFNLQAQKDKDETDKKIKAHRDRIFQYFKDYTDSVSIRKEVDAILDLRPYYYDLDDPEKLKEWIRVVRQQRQGETVSSVSKFAQSLEETPATVYVLKADEIMARGYKHLEEVFYDLPGFAIARSNGTNYVNLYQRGYRSSTSTDRTLILVDGVEDNSLFSGTAIISRQYSLENIKRIEVVYGPSSTMYGSNAHTGVVNIITKDKDDVVNKDGAFSMSGEAGYGMWNTNHVDVVGGDEISLDHEDVWYTIAARYYQSDEQDLSRYDEWNNASWDVGREAYEGALGTTNSDTIDRAMQKDQQAFAELIQPYQDRTKSYYLAGKIGFGNFITSIQTWNTTEGSSAFFTKYRFPGNNQWSSRHSFISNKYEKSLTNKLKLFNLLQYKWQSNPPDSRQVLFRSFYNGLGSEGIFDEEAAQPNLTSTYFYQAGSQLREEINFSYVDGSRLSSIIGLEYRNTSVQGNYVTSNEPNPNLVGNDPDIVGGNLFSVNEIGAYAQAQVKLDSSIIMTGGIRFDNFRTRDINQSAWNPRLSLVYSSDIVVKVIFSEAFRIPTNFQRYSSTSSRDANPDLMAEKASNLEFIVLYDNKKKHKSKNGFTAELSFYNVTYRDIPVLVDISNAKTQFQNLGNILTTGLQVAGDYTQEKLKVYANYSYTRQSVLDASAADSISDSGLGFYGDVPIHSLNLGGNYQITPKLSANLRANYVGAIEASPTNPITDFGAHLVLNGTITYNQKYWSLQGIFRNLLNEEYFHPGIRTANGTTFASRLPQERVNYYLKATFRF